MVHRSRGPRHRTRSKLQMSVKYRPLITNFLREFKTGEHVVIDQDPSSHRGMPFRRFKGKVGTVIDKRGKSYIIEVKEGSKIKKIISRPEHLKKI